MGVGKQREGQRETESKLQREIKAGKAESLLGNKEIKEMREERKFRRKIEWRGVHGVDGEMNSLEEKRTGRGANAKKRNVQNR